MAKYMKNLQYRIVVLSCKHINRLGRRSIDTKSIDIHTVKISKFINLRGTKEDVIA